MKILGFEITKIKETPPLNDQTLEENIGELLIQCNNQLRGNINEKAKVYNEEILEYYFGEIFGLGVGHGYKIKEKEILSEKLNK